MNTVYVLLLIVHSAQYGHVAMNSNKVYETKAACEAQKVVVDAKANEPVALKWFADNQVDAHTSVCSPVKIAK